MSNFPLAKREPPRQPEFWDDADWQRMWLSVWDQRWTSLALVPAASEAPADFSLSLAVTLARVGMTHLGVPIHVADATQVQLSNIVHFIDEIRQYQHAGDLILIALQPVQDNPVTVTIAQTASAAVMCVLLEKMSLIEAKETVARIGRDHFIGSVVLRPSSKRRERA